MDSEFLLCTRKAPARKMKKLNTDKNGKSLFSPSSVTNCLYASIPTGVNQDEPTMNVRSIPVTIKIKNKIVAQNVPLPSVLIGT